MKKLFALLVLCMLLPCAALADGEVWICPNCLVERTTNFCPVCRSERIASVPEIVLVDAGSNYIDISWHGFTGAQSYRVFTGDAAANYWTQVDKVTAAFYTFEDLAPGTAFDVRVRSDQGTEAVLTGAAVMAAVTAAPTPTAEPTPLPTPEPTPLPTAEPTPAITPAMPEQTAYPADLLDHLQYIELPDGTVSITGYTGTQNRIVLPDRINGLPVTEIADHAFNMVYSPHKLSEIVLPQTLQKIGEKAFYMSVDIQSLQVPEGVVFIGGSAFAHCSSLTDLAIPKSVTSIGEDVTRSCPSVTIHVKRYSFAALYCYEHSLHYKID